MASFAGRRRASVPWSVDDASTFAAQKEFKLLQLLSTDKKALATGASLWPADGSSTASNRLQLERLLVRRLRPRRNVLPTLRRKPQRRLTPDADEVPSEAQGTTVAAQREQQSDRL